MVAHIILDEEDITKIIAEKFSISPNVVELRVSKVPYYGTDKHSITAEFPTNVNYAETEKKEEENQ